jgi:F-type H+-transporting ATPase subunit delta
MSSETATNNEQHVADVSAQRVARIYAEALYAAADKRQLVDTVMEELDSLIGDVFPAAPQLESFLCSSAVGRDRKAELLKHTFEGKACETFLNFLLVLNDQGRLELLRTIQVAFRAIRDDRARRINVLVRSAVPLHADQQEQLKNNLRQVFNLEPMLKIEHDPDLLGGIVVRVGDWLFDGSVRTRVNQVRNELLARSSHEVQTQRDRFCSDE